MTLLDRIEEKGNRLPDPATLFVIGTGIVMFLSWLATSMTWEVHSELTGTLVAQSLLSSEGIWWLLSNMVNNFITFPPLAIVLVGMLGIGHWSGRKIRVPSCTITSLYPVGATIAFNPCNNISGNYVVNGSGCRLCCLASYRCCTLPGSRALTISWDRGSFRGHLSRFQCKFINHCIRPLTFRTNANSSTNFS